MLASLSFNYVQSKLMIQKSSTESVLELHRKIRRLRKFFDLDKLIETQTDDEYIKKYYRINQWT